MSNVERSAIAGPDADGGFGHFLERSLGLLEVEHSRSHRRLRALMAPHAIRFEVDGQVVVVRFARDRVHFDADTGEHDATQVRVGRQTLLELVDGERSMLDAILDDRFQLIGDPDSIARFHDAFLVYVRGAIRCPGFPALLDAYRRSRAARPQVRASARSASTPD